MQTQYADTVVFGVVFSCRDLDLPGITEAVGLLANTLPLHLAFDSAQTSTGFLETVFKQILELSAFQWTTPEHGFTRQLYSWSPAIVGLTYTPSALGYLLGSVLGSRWTDYIMQRAAHKAGRIDKDGNPTLIPEDRIREIAVVAGINYPLGLLWWRWTTDKRVFWIAPVNTSISSTLRTQHIL